MIKLHTLCAAMLAFTLAGAALTQQARGQHAQADRFGARIQEADAGYDGYQRTSQYVRARDGVRLAIDIYRPTRQGAPATEPTPIVWTFTPYNRATRGQDGAVAAPTQYARLLANGYAIAVADVRGKGASFGTRAGPADANETNDAYDLTEWLAARPWSNGRVGMMGCSYFGATALQALRAGAPSLRAIFVGTTMFDQYETFARGGIVARGLADEDTDASRVVETDADRRRTMLQAALRDHAANTPTGEFFASTPFRDDINPYTGDDWWRRASFYPYVGDIQPDAGVYVYGGYHDVYSDQTVIKYLNLGENAKLAFGPWPHCETPGFDMDAERVRFFDYWLKGIDNGVMQEPPVHVYVGHAQNGQEWRALDRWPTDAHRARYFLSSEASPLRAPRGYQAAPFEGALRAAPAETAAAPVSFAAPASPGPVVIYGMPRAGVDAYSATFTLPPQPLWREMIGFPTAHLWVSTPETDVDVYVYLEAIRSNGGVEIISRGVLRASRRHTGTAPYAHAGLPWQTHRRADARPLEPNAPVLLDIAMSPVTYTIRPGEHLRLAVTTRPPRPDAAAVPVLNIHTSGAHASFIELPDVDTRAHALGRTPGAERVTPRRPSFAESVDR